MVREVILARRNEAREEDKEWHLPGMQEQIFYGVGDGNWLKRVPVKIIGE